MRSAAYVSGDLPGEGGDKAGSGRSRLCATLRSSRTHPLRTVRLFVDGGGKAYVTVVMVLLDVTAEVGCGRLPTAQPLSEGASTPTDVWTAPRLQVAPKVSETI
ncbi:hypothetical protein ABT186_16985 [Streptomyces sp. NPDC001634]|uniref:hypothetical protein n=1 Tax=Streptomyces sp. NPDC001634 TaxID=3154390 RepID=UPI00332101C5